MVKLSRGTSPAEDSILNLPIGKEFQGPLTSSGISTSLPWQGHNRYIKAPKGSLLSYAPILATGRQGLRGSDSSRKFYGDLLHRQRAPIERNYELTIEHPSSRDLHSDDETSGQARHQISLPATNHSGKDIGFRHPIGRDIFTAAFKDLKIEMIEDISLSTPHQAFDHPRLNIEHKDYVQPMAIQSVTEDNDGELPLSVQNEGVLMLATSMESGSVSSTALAGSFGVGTPTIITAASAVANINALLIGKQWANIGSLTYSYTDSFFNDYEQPYPLSYGNGFTPLNQAQRLATERWLGIGGEFWNVSSNFQATQLMGSADRDATIRIALTSGANELFGLAGRVADFPGSLLTPSNPYDDGDVWFNSTDYNIPVIGSYAYFAFGHEFGHAVGLKHGHDDGYGVLGVNTPALSSNRDSMEFSIMTYRSYVNMPMSEVYPNEKFGYAQTLMMYDIAAIQHMYGAWFGAASGNTNYTFSKLTGEMFIDGVSKGIPGANRIFRTVWDGGGIDTYDFSNYDTNLSVDLRPGSWSDLDVGGNFQRASLGNGNFARGHVFNALQFSDDPRSLIENANGGSGADRLTGHDANNVLKGNGGNDTIQGGRGNDTLDGGGGSDFLSYAGTAESLSIDLGKNLFTGGDAFGDTIIAGSFENVIGSAVNDIIIGDANDNILEGWAGADFLDGGNGSDCLSYEDSNEAVAVYLDLNGRGRTFVGGGHATGDTVVFGTFESVLGSRFNDTIVGDAKTNKLEGGAGADNLDGGNGSDYLSYQRSKNGVAVNLDANSLFGGDADGDIITNPGSFENVIGSGSSDTIVGNAANNIIFGGEGDDTLQGYAANDTIYGGAGADVIAGDDGADWLDGGEGSDTLWYQGSSGAVSVNLRTSLVGGGYATGDTITIGSFENVIGSQFADTIIGSAVSNIIIGGPGADFLDGGDGSDYLSYQGNDVAVAIYLDINGNGDVLVSGGDATGDTIVSRSFENVIGTDFDDIIIGDSRDNIFIGGLGSDYFDGGEGSDYLSYEGSYSLVAVDLFNNSVGGGDATGDTFAAGSIENVVGTVFNDTIIGDSRANILIGGAGSDWLDGGDGNDIIYCGDGNDVVSTTFMDGADTFFGGHGDDSIYGSQGDETFSGDEGDDSLRGYYGDDLIEGGAGRDSLDGGDGLDTLSYATSLGAVVIDLSLSYASGGDANGDIIVNESFENILGSAYSDSITGNSDNNILDGASGNDTINGGMGDDTLLGSAGIDTMYGGDGNDTYVIETVGDLVLETTLDSIVGGIDTVQSTLASYMLTANVENLSLMGTSAIKGTGNSLNNTIYGNSAANTINGDLGADTLSGGNGNDTYVVDNVGDLVVEANASRTSGGNDTVQSSLLTYTLTANVENLTLTGSASINGIGNSLNNSITGNSAANRLNGEAGADVLNGGGGADTLTGGDGSDTYIVENAADFVVETNASLSTGGNDHVQSSLTSYTLTDNVERLTLTGSGAINGNGNGLNNTITGNSAANRLSGEGGADTLNGGGGADTLTGGDGSDTYTVDNAADLVVETNPLVTIGGSDSVRSSLANYTLTANVENLTLTGSAAINGTGNSLNNSITGNSAANSLNAGAGDDTLNGGGGADTLTGGDGSDTYVVENAADQVVETNSSVSTGGNDYVQSSLASYTLTSNVENLTLTGSTAISGTGNSLNNVLTGNSASNRLFGEGGADTLNGGAGADTLTGGDGSDTYIIDNAADLVVETNLSISSGGNDTVQSSLSNYTLTANVENLILTGSASLKGTGNSLSNSITGNSAANTLNGSGGSDILTGGLGADIFRFDTALGSTNVDSITDFSTNQGDIIQLENSVFSALTITGTLAAAAFFIGTSATSTNHRILYNPSTGSLFYDSDGSGATTAVSFSTLSSSLLLTNSSFVVT